MLDLSPRGAEVATGKQTRRVTCAITENAVRGLIVNRLDATDLLLGRKTGEIGTRDRAAVAWFGSVNYSGLRCRYVSTFCIKSARACSGFSTLPVTA